MLVVSARWCHSLLSEPKNQRTRKSNTSSKDEGMGWERYKYVCGFYIFSLKEKKKNVRNWRGSIFQNLDRHMCASWRESHLGFLAVWSQKKLSFFYSWFKNKRITEGLSHRITCAKPDFQSVALDKTLESGYSWDLWWEENLHFTDAEVRRIKILSMLTSPGFHEQGPTRTQLFLATKLYHIWG